MKLIEALCQAELCISLAEARRSISFGSISVNGERVRGDTEVQKDDIIRIGKKREVRL